MGKPRALRKVDRPLLDLRASEKWEIACFDVVQGFALASAVPGIANTVTDQLASIHVIKSVTTAATLGQVCTLGGLSVVGSAAGAYYAVKHIKEEEEKIIRLNKELFILFNIAADRLEALQKPEGIRSKTELKDEYEEALRQIKIAISSKSSQISIARRLTPMSPQSPTGDLPESLKKLDIYIKSYQEHRDSAEGAKEKQLWAWLKEKDIFSDDEAQVDYFLNYATVEQAKDYFVGERKKHVDSYKKQVSDLIKMLSEARKDLSAQETKEFDANVNALKTILEGLFDFAILVSRRRIAMRDVQQEAFELLQEAQAAFDAINAKLTNNPQHAKYPELKNNINSIWEDHVKPLIINVEEHLKHSKDPKSKLIVESTPAVFGPNGSFRSFWREILPPGEKAKGKNSKCVPENFDALIYRSGEKVSRKSMFQTGLITAGSLYTSGQGLYLAAIALGAAALSATVVGAIIGAAVLGLTIMSLAYYYRTTKAQNHRNALADNFKTARRKLTHQEVTKRPVLARPTVAEEKPSEHESMGQERSVFRLGSIVA